MKTLTKRQKEILVFIEDWIERKGYSPTFREIGHAFSFSSVGTVVNHIKALEQKGCLTSQEKKRRSLTPIKSEMPQAHSSEIELPFVGMIQAGHPIEMYSESKNIKVPSLLVRHPDHTYILQVQGDSFTTEKMADGDLLIVEARQEAENGELIIATIQNIAHIKRFFPEESLESAIQGVIIGLMRSY